MNKIWVVARKEIRDSMRDRRTVMNALLMGPILGPVLFLIMFTFITNKEVEKAQETLHIPVMNAELAPNLVLFLEQQGVAIEPPLSDPEQAVRDELFDVVIRITEDYPEQWRSGQSAIVEVIADSSKREIGTTLRRVRGLLNTYGAQIGSLRLQLRGVNPQLMRAVNVKDVDLSTPKSRGALILGMLPYFIIISLFISSMSIAIDTTAGEKERQSLEPLLINPVPRWQIMAGKLFATTLFASISLALSLTGFVIGVSFIPASALNFELNLDAALAVHLFLITIPMALTAAALLTTLAAFAKSFREAQSYMGLVMLIPMLPSMWLLISPVKAETWMMWVPLLSQNVLINEYMRGETVLLSWQLISVFSTLVLGLIIATIAAGLYNRPKLIFNN